MKRLFQLSAVAACLLVGGLNTSAVAQEQEQDDPATDNHDKQFIANQGAARLLAQTKIDPLTTSSTVFTQLTAGSITIPGGQTGYLLATFSGESTCTGTSGSWCTLRVLVNGVEINPVVGADFAFDAVSDDLWESNSMQRISNRLGFGTYSVEVQWAVVGNASFRLDDWLFKVEFWRVS